MAKRLYAYNPVGMDALAPKLSHPLPGTHVVLSDQGEVGRRAGPFRSIENANDGTFHGHVLKSSLIPVTKKNPGKPDPVEAARASALINDRRGAPRPYAQADPPHWNRPGYQMPTPTTLELQDLEGKMARS
jgi:hypothetical protein